MIVGIVRHFKVDLDRPEYMNSAEFDDWQNKYDTSPIITPKEHRNENEWQICFASELLRSLDTARFLFEGQIIQTAMLNEVSIKAIRKTDRKFKVSFWLFVGRMARVFGHKSQP
jgi:hypothetical protein